jgi:hypothetical protein
VPPDVRTLTVGVVSIDGWRRHSAAAFAVVKVHA